METIKIKYFNKALPKLEYIDGKSNWIDLRCSKDMVILKGEHRLIPLGVGMKLPDNYEAHIAPRSSTFKNFKILMTNSVGIVDNSYSGNDDEWKFSALAIEDTMIKEGDRICQFRIMEIQPEFLFEEVENLDEVSRGGFGSTGIK
jgi:dUTP pyrophosphatase